METILWPMQASASSNMEASVLDDMVVVTAGFGARGLGDASHWPRACLTHPCMHRISFD
jgi:hypothetical protein